MNKNNMDWKSFAESLLWHNIVYDKNGDSGWDIMEDEGEIGHWRFSSIITPGTYKPLTWKELALALGLYEEYLTPDGHDCKNCPERKDCMAYFKDDEDHERCHWWMENMMKDEEAEGNDK